MQNGHHTRKQDIGCEDVAIGRYIDIYREIDVYYIENSNKFLSFRL